MIVAGDYSLTIYEGTEQEIMPHLLIPYPDYNSNTNNNDIMLIKVQYVFCLCLLRVLLLPLWLSQSHWCLYWSHCPLSLQLRAPVYLNSYVSIALLPRQGASIAEGRVCRVSGWGYISSIGEQIPSTLRTVTVPVVSTEKCNTSDSFNGSITENMLCAGYSMGGKDACEVRGTFYSMYGSLWPCGQFYNSCLF